VFFGALCNFYLKDAGENILFVYLNFTAASEFKISLVILLLILTIQAMYEEFLVEAIKMNFLMLLIIIASSIAWHSINFIVPLGEPLQLYFTSIMGLTNFLVLLVICVSTAFLGAFLKITYRNYINKNRRIINEFN
jgi:hypothetical protein